MGAIVLGLVHLFPQALGGGDVKMVMALTIWLGFLKSVYVLILAFGIGSLFVLPLLIAKKMNRKSMLPFGPFLAAASFILWFWPESIDRLRIAI
jgi:leader peptidase (prepilin peptidase)/N-methyltransferase